MKHAVFGLLFLLSPFFSYSMESDYLLEGQKIVKKQTNTVAEEIKVYFNTILPKIKLAELSTEYNKLSHSAKYCAFSCMSSQLKFLHSLALSLPTEIQQDIYIKMLENDQKAGKNFYKERLMIDAFSFYNGIVQKIPKDKPVAVLYNKSEAQRNEIFDKINALNEMRTKRHTIIMMPLTNVINVRQEQFNHIDEDIKPYLMDLYIPKISPLEETAIDISNYIGGTFCLFTSFFGVGCCIGHVLGPPVPVLLGSLIGMTCISCSPGMICRCKILYQERFNNKLEID